MACCSWSRRRVAASARRPANAIVRVRSSMPTSGSAATSRSTLVFSKAVSATAVACAVCLVLAGAVRVAAGALPPPWLDGAATPVGVAAGACCVVVALARRCCRVGRLFVSPDWGREPEKHGQRRQYDQRWSGGEPNSTAGSCCARHATRPCLRTWPQSLDRVRFWLVRVVAMVAGCWLCCRPAKHSVGWQEG